MPTIAEALQQASDTFTTSESARLDAELLLCHVLDCDRSHLIAWPEKVLDDHIAETYSSLVARRQQGEPLAYITGEREFWSRRFLVNEHTLIPRPETECLVEFVLQQGDADAELRVADLGTGTGAIAISLACERPQWRISAIDITAPAVELAKRKAAANAAGHVRFYVGDWLQPLQQQPQDIIVSNPPYIAQQDPHLEQGDVRFEPVSALVAGRDGLDAIRRITRDALDCLQPGGWLVLEHGYDQAPGVAEILTAAGYTELTQVNDLSGNPRLSAARKAR